MSLLQPIPAINGSIKCKVDEKPAARVLNTRDLSVKTLRLKGAHVAAWDSHGGVAFELWTPFDKAGVGALGRKRINWPKNVN